VLDGTKRYRAAVIASIRLMVRAALRIVGTFAAAVHALAGVAASAGLVAAASGCAQAAARIDGATALRRGREDLVVARFEAAQREFAAALDDDPHSLEAWRGLVESARRRGALAGIAGRVEQKARDGPQDASGWYALGLLRSAQRRDEEAAAAFSRAAAIAPDMAEIEYRLGAALLAAGRPAQARRPLSRAVELGPGDAAHRVALAACLASLGERVAAMELLREVPRLSPSAADADRTVRLARSLTDPFRELSREERTLIEPALRDLERDAPAPALAHLDAVLARSPALAAGRLLAALAAERLGDSLRASHELHKAAALAPGLPQPHAYLARLLVRERPEAAAREYAEAVKRDPLDPAVLRAFGELDLDRLGQPGRAAESLGRAADLIPDDAGLQALAARAELTAGSSTPARERLARAIHRWRSEPRMLLRVGAAMYDERNRAAGEAVRQVMTQCIDEVLDAVAERDPDNAIARGLRRAAHEG
jgi:tetratricopeptide (TPR) repeat protein